ncbi:uncharacterized protein ATNIH1004_001900 [Aspergillus tanneri]|uniref:Carboxylic ester hydrolase n=1 Tax=Aspergillus tanneri TaxID=1220188 RepID=A0A5M9M369_9EURO|nr:uncharacterized protein ATNIH1004_001900 [Aspergillus tanneri]KAA8641435.1 hypothetical protein ATNIH1004_001900 [Aspergillus tanneri]
MADVGYTIDDFYRFFYIPGIGHCSGGADAPGHENIPAGVPGYNDRYQHAISALLVWTEKDNPPDYLVGTKFEDDDGSIVRECPICPYPNRPHTWVEM